MGGLAGLLAGLAHGLVDSGYFMTDLAWSLALLAAVVHLNGRTSVGALSTGADVARDLQA